MPQLFDMVPDVETLIAMEPEELAGVLLVVLVEEFQRQRRFHVGNYINSIFGEAPRYPRERLEQVQMATFEAATWLEGQALIVPDPTQAFGSGWRRPSRRALALVDGDRYAGYRKASLLPKQLLHATLREKVWIDFISGEYDSAVFLAFKLVEVSVREAAGLSAADIGVKLMRTAFEVETGPLTDPSRERGERQAASDLFAGAIGSYKNPHSHRTVTISDPLDAVEMIMLASHLLRIVDERRKAREAGAA